MSKSESPSEGADLKPATPFAPTRPKDLFGSLRPPGKPKMLEDIDTALLAEAQRRQTAI